MKIKLLVSSLAVMALLLFVPRARAEISFEFFFDNLSPYGEWIEVDGYGTCWVPSGMDENWAPYTDGYWTYTDAGWTWVSYEDFGDIVYHYGRWVRVVDTGWCWVPDYEWGPAWVSWRQTDEHIGWAPLPPEARWNTTVGFSVWVDDYYDIGPAYYNFCPIVDFGAPVIRYVCVPRSSVFSIYGRAWNITNICYNSYSNVVFCGGPNYVIIHPRLRHPIPTLKLVQNTTIVNNNYTIVNNQRVVKFPQKRVVGNTLEVFAPRVTTPAAASRPAVRVSRNVASTQVDRGWRGVADQTEIQRVRERVRSEARGLKPETAPARPVQVTDLRPLPARVDRTAPSPVAVDRSRALPNRKGSAPANATEPAQNAERPIARSPEASRPAQPSSNAEPRRPSRDAQVQPPANPVQNGNRPPVATRPALPETPRGRSQEGERERAEDQPASQPFRESRTPDRSVVERTRPETSRPEVSRPAPGGGRDNTGEAASRRAQAERDAAAQAERQRQAAREQAAQQQAAREQAARQQSAREQAARQQQAAREQAAIQQRRQAEVQQRQQAEAQQRQIQAQRQQQMQRQAEAQQRQIQAQRQQQMQRQQPVQRQAPVERQAQPRQSQQYQAPAQRQASPMIQQSRPQPGGGTSRGGREATREEGVVRPGGRGQ
jgi:hypothetical protein